MDVAIDLPGKNWPQAFHKRHPELTVRKVKAVEWNRHDNNIYDKRTHWFDVIMKEIHDLVIVLEIPKVPMARITKAGVLR